MHEGSEGMIECCGDGTNGRYEKGSYEMCIPVENEVVGLNYHKGFNCPAVPLQSATFIDAYHDFFFSEI